MADLTPNEIEQLLQKAAEEQATLGKVSKETAAQLDNVSKSAKGAADKLGQAFKKLGSTTLDISKSIMAGDQSMQQFNGAVGDLADGIASLLSKIPLIGKYLGIAAKAAGEYAKEVTKQTDALYKGYQDLSKVGATGAQGIQSVFDNMQKFGYGIEELNNMTALIQANSAALASFRGTAASGTDAFANMASEIRNGGLGRQLLTMGVKVDDINTGLASYIRIQTMYGRAQSMSQEQMTLSAAKYLEQLSLMAKVTGTSAEALAKQQEDAMAEDAYAAKRYELQQRADAGDAQAARKLEQMDMLIRANANNPELRQAIIKAYSGYFQDPEVQKLYFAAPEAVMDIMSETHDASRTMGLMASGFKRNMDMLGTSIQAGANLGPGVASQMKLMGEYEKKTLKERIDQAKDETIVTDQATKDYTDSQIAMRNSRDSMQSFVNLGVAPATKALKLLTESGDALLESLPGDVAGRPESSLWDRLKSIVTGQPATPPISGTPGAGAGATPGAGRIAGEPPGISGDEKPDPGALTQITTKTGKSATVGSKYATQFQNMVNWLESQGYQINSIGGYNPRKIAGTNQWSAHSYGAAIDINPGANPMGPTLITDMPQGVGKAANSFGLGWGGDWRGKKDAMHFSAAGNEGGAGYQFGGIASGPLGGYTANMFGDNAIVPLGSGNSIPVELPDFSESLEDQSNILSDQLTKLDDLIRVMSNQVSISQRILMSQS